MAKCPDVYTPMGDHGGRTSRAAYSVPREAQDQVSPSGASRRRLKAPRGEKRFDEEIVPVNRQPLFVADEKKTFEFKTGRAEFRPETTLEGSRPGAGVLDRRARSTAGNSVRPLSDRRRRRPLVMSKEKAQSYGLKGLGTSARSPPVGVDPAVMGELPARSRGEESSSRRRSSR